MLRNGQCDGECDYRIPGGRDAGLLGVPTQLWRLLSPTEGVKAGSTLVAYDFAGYIDGSIAATSRNISATTAFASTGLILDPSFTDDPNIVNLVFTYTGPDFQPRRLPRDRPTRHLISPVFSRAPSIER